MLTYHQHLFTDLDLLFRLCRAHPHLYLPTAFRSDRQRPYVIKLHPSLLCLHHDIFWNTSITCWPWPNFHPRLNVITFMSIYCPHLNKLSSNMAKYITSRKEHLCSHDKAFHIIFLFGCKIHVAFLCPRRNFGWHIKIARSGQHWRFGAILDMIMMYFEVYSI